MLLNLLTVSVFIGVVAATGYGSGSAYSNDAPSAYFIPPRHHYRGHRWRSSSDSSDSDEKWHCSRLGVFNITGSAAEYISAPKIGYFTHQGKEKAIIVCQNPQIQLLFGQSPDANVAAGITNQYKDNALLSISTKSGLVLDCNRRHERYEAYNFFTEKTIPIHDVACLTVPSSLVTSTLGTIASSSLSALSLGL
ncbi:unnamed protein product [Caenorhabditis sp. 36 PRJEB53466]|nr:unnamed protein product [Caenorhabditis sp. 36 PRJEB53466]